MPTQNVNKSIIFSVHEERLTHDIYTSDPHTVLTARWLLQSLHGSFKRNLLPTAASYAPDDYIS